MGSVTILCCTVSLFVSELFLSSCKFMETRIPELYINELICIIKSQVSLEI